jgi:hypothetical protein
MRIGKVLSEKRLILGIIIISLMLACNVTNLRPGQIFNDLFEDADQQGITGELTRDQELDFYQNMEGEKKVDSQHLYQNEYSDCKPDYYFMGEQHSLEIDHIPGNVPAEDKITIRDGLGIRDYRRYSPEQPFLYCRTYMFEHTADEVLPRLECIKITTAWRYELIIYFGNVMNDEFLCYKGLFEAENVEEVASVDNSEFEACLAKEGEDYISFHYDPTFEQGSRSTLCKYRLVVLNNSNDDLKLMFYESFDNRGSGGEGMTWDHWMHVNILPAGEEFKYDGSHVKNEDGSETWAHGTMYLLMYDTPGCFPFTISEDENNLHLWEEYSIELDNPCW